MLYDLFVNEKPNICALMGAWVGRRVFIVSINVTHLCFTIKLYINFSHTVNLAYISHVSVAYVKWLIVKAVSKSLKYEFCIDHAIVWGSNKLIHTGRK